MCLFVDSCFWLYISCDVGKPFLGLTNIHELNILEMFETHFRPPVNAIHMPVHAKHILMLMLIKASTPWDFCKFVSTKLIHINIFFFTKHRLLKFVKYSVCFT